MFIGNKLLIINLKRRTENGGESLSFILSIFEQDNGDGLSNVKSYFL